jgi:hypothetical protein
VIYIIKAADEGDALLLANAIRDNRISSGCGALLVNPDFEEHPVQHQVEKIIAGAPIHPAANLARVPWKKDSVVLAIGDDAALKEIEAFAPGFIAAHGPVRTITVE